MVSKIIKGCGGKYSIDLNRNVYNINKGSNKNHGTENQRITR